jgi:hypothetical protein
MHNMCWRSVASSVTRRVNQMAFAISLDWNDWNELRRGSVAMTPQAFSAALAALGWSQRQLAAQLGVDHVVVQRMSRGTRRIEPQLARWLHAAQQWLQANPLPALTKENPRHEAGG